MQATSAALHIQAEPGIAVSPKQGRVAVPRLQGSVPRYAAIPLPPSPPRSAAVLRI